MGLLALLLEQFGRRQATRRDNHHIGVKRGYIACFGPSVEVEGHIARRALRHPPVNEADHLTPTR